MKKLYENYDVLLNKEFLSGKINLDEYNDLFNKYNLKKGIQINEIKNDEIALRPLPPPGIIPKFKQYR